MPAFLLAVLPSLWSWIVRGISVSGTVLAAIITAIPATITALAGFIKVMTSTPLNAFLLSAMLCAPTAFLYGLSYDAPLRRDLQKRAIDGANHRADLAIAKIKRDYEAELAKLRVQKKRR